jgi:nitroreductase
MIESSHSAGDETMAVDTLIDERDVLIADHEGPQERSTAATATEGSQEAIARCVASVVRSRRSVRAFKAQPLRRGLVEEILEDAACAPSGANTQPWRVYGVSGTVKDELAAALVSASRAATAPAPSHFPEPLPDVFRARLTDFGGRYYASLGIDRNDTPARKRQTERNYSFFGRSDLQHRPQIEAAQLDRPRTFRAERDDRSESARHRHVPAGCLRAVP